MRGRGSQRSRSFWWWRLGAVKGIAIRVHLTLILLLAWIAVGHAATGAAARGTAIGVFVVLSCSPPTASLLFRSGAPVDAGGGAAVDLDGLAGAVGVRDEDALPGAREGDRAAVR